MRNKELYAENLIRLNTAFDTEMIAVKDASEYVGIDSRTFIKNAPVKKIGRNYYISKTMFASWLS